MSEFALDLTPHGTLDITCIVNGPIQTNTYFVCSAGEVVVIDPAWEGEKLVRDYLATRPDAKIVATVCTHGHSDHVGGVAGVRRAVGGDLPYLLPERDADFVAPALESMRTLWRITFEDPGEPTRLLSEGDTVDFGDVSLQVIETPGHTPGGIVLFGATESGNVAFVGDTLFPGSHGRTDLEGGDERTILASLAKMARLLPGDTVCMIGHNGSTTMADEVAHNPFMAGA